MCEAACSSLVDAQYEEILPPKKNFFGPWCAAKRISLQNCSSWCPPKSKTQTCPLSLAWCSVLIFVVTGSTVCCANRFLVDSHDCRCAFFDITSSSFLRTKLAVLVFGCARQGCRTRYRTITLLSADERIGQNNTSEGCVWFKTCHLDVDVMLVSKFC